MDVLQTRKSADNSGMTTTEFGTTPRMSTYIVAFAVSPLKSNCQKDAKGRRHCIHVAEENVNRTQVALETSIRAVKYFEDLLQIDYPLSKLDHFGTPCYMGAMENWGLIVYEQAMLLDKANIETIFHEIAHQWFGNLVSKNGGLAMYSNIQ